MKLKKYYLSENIDIRDGYFDYCDLFILEDEKRKL